MGVFASIALAYEWIKIENREDEQVELHSLAYCRHAIQKDLKYVDVDVDGGCFFIVQTDMTA